MKYLFVIGVLLAGSVTARAQQPRQPSAQQRAAAAQMGPTPGPAPDTLAETPNPFANAVNAMGEGRRLFNWYNCAGCHGDHAGGGMGPRLGGSTWRYGGTQGGSYTSTREGGATGGAA